MLLSLPTETILHILQLAIESGSLIPLCLVNRRLLHLAQCLLHGELLFRYGLQLALFANSGPSKLATPPRTMTVQLSGGTVDPDLFDNMGAVFKKCIRLGARVLEYAEPKGDETHQVLLDILSLRLNSHTSDLRPFLIHQALCFVNPQKFSWTGPDPDHHFSNAIVPQAAYGLFRAVQKWSQLQELILSSISFKYFDEPGRESPLQERLPNLQFICFRQCIFLAPRHIVSILSAQPDIGKIRLIDAYRSSIWGQRIRRSDVEGVVVEKVKDEIEAQQLIERIRSIVSCEKKTERIMGGDRVADGVVFL